VAKFSEKTARKLAEEYGFAYAFMKSDKSLWHLFKSAVKGTWSAEKFAAKLKESSWYKKHSESIRQYQLLKSTDPATYSSRLAQTMAEMKDSAVALGARLSSEQLKKLSDNALKFNWNSAQIANILGDYVKAKNGVYTGDTGDAIDQIEKISWANGIRLSEATKNKYAMNIAKGNYDADYIANFLRQQAASAYPAFADQLNSGMDMYDISSAYRESMAQILEINPADVDMFDKTIKSALQVRTPEGKPTSKTLYQFEQDLRKDDRWKKTRNARSSLDSVASAVLKDFGFMGG